MAGALLTELPLGWWTERASNDNLTYAAIDHVEELLGQCEPQRFAELEDDFI